MLVLVLIYLCVTLTLVFSQPMTPDDAKAILDKHNEYRRKESAANMYLLHWNITLQERADGWAQKCHFKHEQNRDVGENLYFDTDHENEVFIRGLKMWHDEKSLWRYTKDACFTTCHYTQMVTGYTTTVGCSANVCSSLRVGTQVFQDAMLLVCYYYPRGNFVGHFPFEYGATCSKCGQGDTCSNQLCVTSDEESKTAPEFIKSLRPMKPFSPHRPIKALSAFKALLQTFSSSSSASASSARSHRQHSRHEHHHHGHQHHHHSHQHYQGRLGESDKVVGVQYVRPVAQPQTQSRQLAHIGENNERISPTKAPHYDYRRKENEFQSRYDEDRRQRQNTVNEKREQEIMRIIALRKKEALRLKEHRELEMQRKLKEDRERKERERKEQERLERFRLERERENRERMERERNELKRLERERKERERLERERQDQERLEREREEQERLEIEREEQERLERDRKHQERLERELKEQERLERERQDQERLERERREHERLEIIRKEQEYLEGERQDKERLERERKEKERLEIERKEQERLERERQEQERLERERKEQERLEVVRKEEERLEIQRKEQERLEIVRKEQERLEIERKEQERLEIERKEQELERLERERKEQERLEKERKDKERLGRERKEQERLEIERKEQESLERELNKTEHQEGANQVLNPLNNQRYPNKPEKTVNNMILQNSLPRTTQDSDHKSPPKVNHSTFSVTQAPSSLSYQHPSLNQQHQHTSHNLDETTTGTLFSRSTIHSTTQSETKYSTQSKKTTTISSPHNQGSLSRNTHSGGNTGENHWENKNDNEDNNLHNVPENFKTSSSSTKHSVLSSSSHTLSSHTHQNTKRLNNVHSVPLSRNHRLNSYSNRRNPGSRFVGTIVKVIPRAKKANLNDPHNTQTPDITINNNTSKINNLKSGNSVSTGPNDSVNYATPNNAINRKLRFKMSEKAMKRARRRRRRLRKQMMARLQKEPHPHREKFVYDEAGRRCVDRLPRCHLWVSKCHKSALVTMSCPLSCGKCGKVLDISIFLLNASHNDSTLFLKKSGDVTLLKRHRKKKKNRFNETPGPQKLILKPIKQQDAVVKTRRRLRNRRLRHRSKKERKTRRKKRGRKKRRRQNASGLCRDDPNYIRTCRTWTKRGFCEDNWIVRNVQCRWSCGTCD